MHNIQLPAGRDSVSGTQSEGYRHARRLEHRTLDVQHVQSELT